MSSAATLQIVKAAFQIVQVSILHNRGHNLTAGDQDLCLRIPFTFQGGALEPTMIQLIFEIPPAFLKAQ
ncbi:MAG: hypothetical protein GX472_09410 [Methanomicrobiales archaeon]|nr:hypothetical protein [Methanomicrobiales archaeon]